MKNILFVASECVPFIKTGGLADVVGSLPKYFPKEYFDVRVVIPKYAGIKEQFKNQMRYVTNFYMDLNWRQQYVGIFEMEYEGIKFYFIDNEEHFGGSTPYAGMPWDLEKFAYFSKAALSILPTIGFRPDLIHCHDWQTGLVPVYLHERFQADEFYRGINTSNSSQKKTPHFLRCPLSSSITLSYSARTTPAFLTLPCHMQALKSVRTLQLYTSYKRFSATR